MYFKISVESNFLYAADYTCRNFRISAEEENLLRNYFPRKIGAKFRILKYSQIWLINGNFEVQIGNFLTEKLFFLSEI